MCSCRSLVKVTGRVRVRARARARVRVSCVTCGQGQCYVRPGLEIGVLPLHHTDLRLEPLRALGVARVHELGGELDTQLRVAY